MREAVIVTGFRTAVGKARRGRSRALRPEVLGATVLRRVLQDVAGRLPPEALDDVILGCAMPEGAQGLNMARLIALQAGLPESVPAMTVNRFCASGLQAIAQAAERIVAGGADAILAGGVESMSYVPLSGFRMAPSPDLLAAGAWEGYMAVGLTAERVAEQYGVTRAAQDEFALRSHTRAAAAVAAGVFRDEIVPVRFEEVALGADGRPERRTLTLDADEHLRRGTTLETLAKLRPSFKEGGTVTAGNSSPLSDGAAGVLVMERRRAEALGLTPRLRLAAFAVAGVPPALMGIGPIRAIPKALERAGLRLADLDLVELNEAFAAQAVAVIRAVGLSEEQVNVNGGAIALGHPLGATGAKLTVQLLNELRRRGGRYGMVTMCIGGGQGAAGIFERLN